MKRNIGWVVFVTGAILTGAFFIGGFVLFFASSCSSGEAQSGGQAIGFFIALIGIPFYFVAKLGWHLSHPESPKEILSLAQTLSIEKKPTFDPNEQVLTIIKVVGDKALFFTTTRVIIANTYEDTPIWTLPFTMLFNSNTSHSKFGRIKKLKPDQILMDDPLNYAIAYSGLKSVRFYKIWIGRKIEIIAVNAAISFHPLRMGSSGKFTNQFGFWLIWPWRWDKYKNVLSHVLQGKLE